MPETQKENLKRQGNKTNNTTACLLLIGDCVRLFINKELLFSLNLTSRKWLKCEVTSCFYSADVSILLNNPAFFTLVYRILILVLTMYEVIISYSVLKELSTSKGISRFVWGPVSCHCKHFTLRVPHGLTHAVLVKQAPCDGQYVLFFLCWVQRNKKPVVKFAVVSLGLLHRRLR